MPRHLLRLLLVPLFATAVFAQPEGWTDDYEAALALAKEQNKHVLVDFTGSDWCGWCVKLDEEVFSQAEFKAYAAKTWVLVYLDFPNAKKVRDAAQNQKLKDQFKVEGFPTILLLDATGAEIGRTGYRDGGPAKYVEHLEKQLAYPRLKSALDGALAAAKSDDEKVALYLELCKAAKAVDKIADVAAHLDVADPTNDHGLHTALATAEARVRLEDGDGQGALDRLAALEAKFKGAPGKGVDAQGYYLARGEAYGSLDKEAELFANFKLAYQAAPDTELGPRIKEFLEEKGQKVD